MVSWKLLILSSIYTTTTPKNPPSKTVSTKFPQLRLKSWKKGRKSSNFSILCLFNTNKKSLNSYQIKLRKESLPQSYSLIWMQKPSFQSKFHLWKQSWSSFQFLTLWTPNLLKIRRMSKISKHQNIIFWIAYSSPTETSIIKSESGFIVLVCGDWLQFTTIPRNMIKILFCHALKKLSKQL